MEFKVRLDVENFSKAYFERVVKSGPESNYLVFSAFVFALQESGRKNLVQSQINKRGFSR